MAKKPTGSRPKPSVAGTSAAKISHSNATRPGAKHKSMPASRRDATMGDTSKMRKSY